MPGLSHVFSSPAASWTGTVTVFNSQGSTTTVAASNLVRPPDWNSVHNFFATLTGANTNNASTVSGTAVALSGMGAVTLVGSTGTLGISAPAAVNYSALRPFYLEQFQTGQQGQNNLHIAPFEVPYPAVQCDRIIFNNSYTCTSNSSNSFTLSMWFGIYTRNVSTLSLVTSTSSTWGITNSGTVGNFSLVSGIRNYTVPFTTTLTQCNYWAGVISQTATGGGAGMSMSQLLASQAATAFAGLMSSADATTAAATVFGMGVFSSTTNAMPNSIPVSSIVASATIALRPPLWRLLSQTA